VADPSCQVHGELVVQASGAAAPSVFPLEAGLWKPLNSAKPERGCTYRKGPVVATVLIKPGRTLNRPGRRADQSFS
jgi:hypothetical protein